MRRHSHSHDFAPSDARRRPLWTACCAVALMTLVGCAGKQLNSRVDPAFLKKVQNDPFPSAASNGVLPTPKS